MHNLNISPDWTDNELAYFKIVFKDVDAPAFFGKTSLPPPSSVSPAILQNANATPGMTEEDLQFFNYLESAMEENDAGFDFAAHLCRLFRYNRPGGLIRTRKEMPFVMGGKTVIATADVTVRDKDQNFLLVVQGSKREDKAAAKLMAECIAAFHHNAHAYPVEDDRQPLQSQVIPGMTMVGSTAVFYRAPITKELLEAVSLMKQPAEETIVLRFVPPVPELDSYHTYGMTRVENRLPVMQCLEAFKELLYSQPHLLFAGTSQVNRPKGT